MGSDESRENAPLAVLLANRQAFLRYLQRRVGDAAVAEDILQDAFARSIAQPEQLPDNEGVVPWFYRLLRNATIDQYRRRAASNRALEAFAHELEAAEQPTEEARNEICACVGRLAATLKPEYAEVLTAVEVDGQPVKTYAETSGLTANNAGVRLFRARDALRRRVIESCGACAEHGCVDCSCRATSSRPVAR